MKGELDGVLLGAVVAFYGVLWIVSPEVSASSITLMASANAVLLWASMEKNKLLTGIISLVPILVIISAIAFRKLFAISEFWILFLIPVILITGSAFLIFEKSETDC